MVQGHGRNGKGGASFFNMNIRKRIRQQRQQIPAQQAQIYAQQAARIASTHLAFKKAQRIGFYLTNDGELDPYPLLLKALHMGKQIYLPVLHPWQKKLWFAPWQPGQRLYANRFGIPEPMPRNRVPIWSLNILIMPLVAFDEQGHRLGMGGGYYDRSLAYLRHRRLWRSPQRWGYAYELQKITAIQQQPWDIGLNRVITEKNCYDFFEAVENEHHIAHDKNKAHQPER